MPNFRKFLVIFCMPSTKERSKLIDRELTTKQSLSMDGRAINEVQVRVKIRSSRCRSP